MMGVSDVSHRQICCQVRAIWPLRVLFGLSAIRALGNVWSSRLHYFGAIMFHDTEMDAWCREYHPNLSYAACYEKAGV